MRSISYMAHNIQIRKKLMISYILVVFIPVLSVGLLLTHSLQRITIDHATRQSVNNVDKIKKRAERLLTIPTEISNKIYFDKKLKNLVSNNYTSILQVVDAYNEYSDFTDYLRLYKEVSGIRLYSENATLLNNWTMFLIDAETRNAAWYREGLANRGKIEWFYIPDVTHNHAQYLSLVREIFFDNMTFCGLLVITINPDDLKDTVSQEPFETLIVTEDGAIISAKDVSLIGKTLRDVHLDGLFEAADTGIHDVQYDGNAAKAIMESVATENSKNRLRIISIVPTAAITMEARKVSGVAFSIIFVSLLVSIAMILFFSRMLSKRISVLSRDIRLVAMGDFSRSSVVEGKDEIGQLARHFNFMVRSIKELMSEVSAAHRQKNALEIKQKEMKLKMLANQVNPHFLFNVLETIRMKAHTNRDSEIANAVKALGQLLRHNLEIGQDPVPLVDELSVVSKYLDIQKFRFGDKIDYVLPSADETGGCTIIPMVLQPIVENAMIHGLENKEGKGMIEVKLEKDGQRLRLIVADDGEGIDTRKREQIIQSLGETEDEDKPSHRIGLRNVHQRLRLYYGPEFGLVIESERGAGTRVAIHFPAEGGSTVV